MIYGNVSQSFHMMVEPGYLSIFLVLIVKSCLADLHQKASTNQGYLSIEMTIWVLYPFLLGIFSLKGMVELRDIVSNI